MDVRKVPDAMMFALIADQAARRLAEAEANFSHLQKMTVPVSGDYTAPTESLVQVTAANATNEATSVALANQIKSVYNGHVVDAVAHDSAVSAVVATANATNTATAITLANATKAAYNTHRTASDVHYNDDTTNSVTSADATDQATLNTLVNEIKVDLNAHVADAPAGMYLNLVPA